MLIQIEPRLRRVDVMLNSFSSCVANTSEEFSRTPEMSFGKIIPQPRMLLQKFKGTITFKQLKGFADRHCRWQLNKEMHVVGSDVNLVNFTSMFDCNFGYEPLAINSDAIELKRIFGIFGLPHKVESILPEGMTKTFQIHFFPPESARGKIAQANSIIYFKEDVHSHPLYTNSIKELNFMEDGNSSLGLKAEVSLPWM